MSKKVILTGLRANNDLTIGNYFGAILPIIDMATDKADEYQINLFVPDLHSFTTPVDHSKLLEQINHNLRIFIAAGLPLEKADVYIYRQSYIPAHSELTWILDCFTGFGEMNRMTQFKDKSKQLITNTGIVTSATDESAKANTSVGLFNYPVLMASDILLYGANYVPVGEDQTQHLEFTRDIAERMNNKFKENLFVVPEPVKKQHEFFGNDQGLRIKDLQDPTKKMSKSEDSDKGVIFLGDNPDTAVKKIMSAATDSLASISIDWENQPGITNLLQILALLTHKTILEIEAEWKGNSNYGDFKKAVAEEMRKFLESFQAKIAEVEDKTIANKLATSEAAMNEIANATLLKVQQAVGLRA